MLNRLKALMTGAPLDGDRTPDPGEAVRAAAATLLVEAAMMDGSLDDDERGTIEGLLRDRFALSEAEARSLLEAATTTVADSNELYGFTRTIKDNFDEDQRIEMVEMLWEVAYADGELHDYEANLVRRVCGLIYVPDQESGKARKRVLERLGIEG